MPIIVYTKTNCPWSERVVAYLKRNAIPFEERNVEEYPAFAQDLKEKTGQNKSPTLDINGIILSDVGVAEVAEELAKQRLMHT